MLFRFGNILIKGDPRLMTRNYVQILDWESEYQRRGGNFHRLRAGSRVFY